jgi:RND family efflux transporter MFP subunit
MNKKVMIGGIIVIAAAGLITAGIVKSLASGGNSIPVSVATIEKGSISSAISSDGVLEEVDKAEVFFDTPLKVDKVFVEEGQKVTKGQPLLELDIDALNSQLETLKVNRNAQQLSVDSKALDAEVERASNNLKAAERNYNDSKKKYEDNKALYASNAISKSELDMSENAFIEADSGMSGLKNARIAYNTAVENRNNTKATASDSLKATDIQIEDLEKKIASVKEDCTSPIDGVVANVGADEGSYTSAVQAAYKIINPDKLQIRAKINEFDIKSVAVGQKVKITGDAIPKETEITGIVKSISPVAVTNMTSNGSETVVEVIIQVDGAGDVLKPGLNVTCEISTVNKDNILLAPMEAFVPDKDNNMMAFVVDGKTNIITQKKVDIGINSDMQVEVLKGLNEGDKIVLDPQPSYRDGLHVRIKK